MIPVNEPLLNGNEKKYLGACIDTGWISSEGPFVSAFEECVAAITERRFGVAVANGSVALETAVLALGIGRGDEVILPAFTIISCAAAIVRAGATPVLVDADPDTWNMDVRAIQQKITGRTKAIMVVHIYGLPADMDPVLQLAAAHGLYVIEDAAEQIGQTYKGRAVGSFGHISTFSFYPNKHITTGEGGMIVTDDEQLADKCRLLRNLCFMPGKRFVHKDHGFNFRMTNMQAALGMAQIERLQEYVMRKRAMGERYTALLCELSCIQLPLTKTDYADNIYWVFGIVLHDEVPFDAAHAMQLLSCEGIGSRPFFWAHA